MLANRQLNALADRKLLLQARITVHRLECVMAGTRLAQPLALVDRVWGHWRRLSPWVKFLGVPLGILGVRKMTRASDGGTSKGKLAALLGLLPVAIEAWKGFREHQRTRVP